ncbi:response regulator [Altericista sp. CCNU0014]|uniref:hybrid sensor histidine kinase/response regulator n=1 Tax=Altericista sp. CCNU0014 TaxID=3082949 RepID=UPI003850EE0C
MILPNFNRQNESRQRVLQDTIELSRQIGRELLELRSARDDARSLTQLFGLIEILHTLKGGVAYLDLLGIELLAHRLEGNLQALWELKGPFEPECLALSIDIHAILEDLLFACAQEEQVPVAGALARAQPLFTQLEAKLGQIASMRVAPPKSVELDRTVVQLVLQAELPQVLDDLEALLGEVEESGTSVELESQLKAAIHLGSFLELPELVSIARTTLVAFQEKAQTLPAISRLMLAEFRKAQSLFFGNAFADRVISNIGGGEPHVAQREPLSVAAPARELESLPHDREYAEFLEDAREWLEAIERGVLGIRENRSPAQIHDLMRTVHTLKGSAAGAKLEPVRAIAHALETAIKALAHPEAAIDSELEALLFQGYECLRLSIAAVMNAATVDRDEVLNRSARVFKQIQAKMGALLTQDIPLPSACELGVDVVRAIFQTDVERRLQSLTDAVERPDGADLAVTLREQLEIFAGIAESFDLPGFGAIASTALSALERHPDRAGTIANLALTDFRRGQALVLKGEYTRGGEPSVALLQLTSPLQEAEPQARDEREEASSTAAFSSAPQTIRIDIQRLEHLNRLTGILLASQHRQESANEHFQATINNLQQRFEQHQQTLKHIRALYPGPQNSSNPDDLSAPRFSDEENLQARELQILLQSALAESLELADMSTEFAQFSRQSNQTLDLQQQILREVRNGLVEARIVPLGKLFERLARILDLLMADYGKPVELRLTGTEILVDKAIAERLYDPLLHLLRNAFDHGIESPEIRQRLDKPSAGQIGIHAYLEGQNTFIEVSDDGRGLDFQRIRERAVQLDLQSPEQASLLPEEALTELLFEPGFSTVVSANDLSGRGVGLDAVRSQLRSLKGSIQVTSQPQQGTVFTLRVPNALTIATFKLSDASVAPNPIASSFSPSTQPGMEPSIRRDPMEELFSNNLIDATSEGASDPTLEEIFGPSSALPSTPTQSDEPNRAAIAPRLQPSEQRLKTDRLFIWKYRAIVFVLPYDTIAEHVIPHENQTLQHQRQKLLSWHEQIIPIYSLSEWLDAVDLPSEPALGEIDFSAQSMLTLVVRLNQTIFAIESPIDCLVTKPELRIQRFADEVAHPSYVYRCLSFDRDDSVLLIDIAALLTQRLSHNSDGVSAGKNAVSAQVYSIARSGQGTEGSAIGQKTILVVDDSKMVREILKKTLKSAGYRVLEAKNGQEGIDVAVQNPDIDLAICDVAMPVMNGFDFLKQCRQYTALETIPVVMLSNCTSDVHQNLARRLGAAAYFTKPYIDQQLLSALQTLLKAGSREANLS